MRFTDKLLTNRVLDEPFCGERSGHCVCSARRWQV